MGALDETRLAFPTSINLADLAEEFRTVPGDEVMDFILRLDEIAADYDFTVRLRNKLNEVIAENDAAAEGYFGNPTEQFLRWLIRMDDPSDEQGVKDLRELRLSQIFDRAHALLGGE